MRPPLFRVSLGLAVALIAPIVRLPIEVSPQTAEPVVVEVVRAIPSNTVAWADSDDDIEIDDIGRVKRGKEHVLVRADVGKSGLTCSLKVKYADGNADSPDDVESDKKGICEIYFDVPDRKSVVGDAIAKVRVTTSKGEERAKSARIFTVRDGRK